MDNRRVGMDKEFEEYWATHQKHLLLNAPENLRAQYEESNRLDSPLDWFCFGLPIAVGVLVQPFIKLQSEILSWGIVLVIVVLLFALMQMVKPHLSKKKTELQAIDEIKRYYYERYKKTGKLDSLEPWND